jgi:hypothetical protein
VSQSFVPKTNEHEVQPPTEGPTTPSLDAPTDQTTALSTGSVGPSGGPTLTDVLPRQVLSHILSFLPHRDVVSSAQTNTGLHAAAQHTPLEGTGTTLGMLNEVMSGHELLGYHGAPRSEASSLYGGLSRDRSGENWNGTGQLGPGFYLFPSDWDKAESQASKYGEDPTAYRVFGRGLGEPYDRKLEGGETWPRSDLFEDPMVDWDPEDVDRRFPYLHPKYDSVRDKMDSGGLPELKLNPHVFDETARKEARDALRRFPWGFNWTPEDWEQETDDTYDQTEFDERMRDVSVQIAPTPREDGTLGPEFLEAIGARWRREHPPRDGNEGNQ